MCCAFKLCLGYKANEFGTWCHRKHETSYVHILQMKPWLLTFCKRVGFLKLFVSDKSGLPQQTLHIILLLCNQFCNRSEGPYSSYSPQIHFKAVLIALWNKWTQCLWFWRTKDLSPESKTGQGYKSVIRITPKMHMS